jgi:hypothetical protein
VSSGPESGWYYSLYALNRPSDIAPGIGQPLSGPDGVPWCVCPSGLVGTIANELDLMPPTEAGQIKTLLRPAVAQPGVTVDVAADIPGDRLFVISANGTIAEIDHVSDHARVSYNPVDLNGNTFQSAWAGMARSHSGATTASASSTPARG